MNKKSGVTKENGTRKIRQEPNCPSERREVKRGRGITAQLRESLIALAMISGEPHPDTGEYPTPRELKELETKLGNYFMRAYVQADRIDKVLERYQARRE